MDISKKSGGRRPPVAQLVRTLPELVTATTFSISITALWEMGGLSVGEDVGLGKEFEPCISNTFCFLLWVGGKALITNSLCLLPVFLFEKVICTFC